MKTKRSFHLDFVVDKLTNSIQNTISGDSFATDILRLTINNIKDMGHIKEPKGVDFIIASDPLTDVARQEISEFIRNYRKKTMRKKISSKKEATSKNSKSIQ